MARKSKGYPTFVYCITEVGSPQGPCKVGIATYLDCRLSSLQGGNHRQLRFEWYSAFTDRYNALEVERHILGRLRPSIYGDPGPRKKLFSEWLDASPEEVWEAGRELLEALLEEEAA